MVGDDTTSRTATGAASTVTAAPLVQLRAASRTFEADPPVHAMRGVDLTVHRGESVAIVGPSGSGKSTLLNVIGLLDRLTSGAYQFDGTDVSSLGEAERCAVRSSRIGFVFQAFHLLAHRSALENVMVGSLYQGIRRRERAERAHEALQQVGLTPRAEFTPAHLSGGERQRVAIARALAARPSVLLCDEPTGNLDTANTVAILELLHGLVQDGLTVVVITHDEAVASSADRRVRMVDGQLWDGR